MTLQHLVDVIVQLMVAGGQLFGTVLTLLLQVAVAGSQLLVAVATLALAAVAVGKEWIAYKFGFRPKLRVHLRNPLGERMPVRLEDGTSRRARYYHLRVTNENRWALANHARVEVVDVLRPISDGRFTSSGMVEGVPLWWRYATYKPAHIVVGPAATCDLLQVREDSVVVLQVQYSPNNFNGTLDGNQKMRVLVEARSDYADSEILCIEIGWDGKFSDDDTEMATHLVVSEVLLPDAG